MAFSRAHIADCPSRYYALHRTVIFYFSAESHTSYPQFHPNMVFSASPQMSLTFFHQQYTPKILLTPLFIFLHVQSIAPITAYVPLFPPA